jgi:hypothetical protein
MELHFSTVLPIRSTFSALKFHSKPTQDFKISQPKPGFLNSGPRSVKFPIRPCARRVWDPSPDQEEEEDIVKDGERKKAKAFRWRSVFLGETSIDTNSAQSSKKKEKDMTDYLEDPGSMDWCVRARKLALKSIEQRGFGHKLERMVTPKKKKKKRKSNKGKTGKLNLGSLDHVLGNLGSDDEQEEEEDGDGDLLFTLDLDNREEVEENTSSKNDQTALREKISQFADGLFEERRAKAKAAFIGRLSKFSGPSNVKMEISLNKQIVNARTAEEVLEVVSDTVTDVAKGLSPSPLSPFNIATALHRIAKNMEKVRMINTRRLGFARQREMSLLVGIAMTALPNCSAQGVSNIAWALSKIGGDLLYQSEMDRVAVIAITKVNDFNSQNVANVALAYATMRHAAPELFTKLVSRARELVETFKEREITQFIWACATLNVPTDPLLDVLDTVYHKHICLLCDNELEEETLDEIENEASAENLEDIEDLNEIEDETENEISFESFEDIEELNEIEDETDDEILSESLEDVEELNEIEDETDDEILSESLEDKDDLEDIENIEDIDVESLDKFLGNVSSSDESHETHTLNFTRDQIANIAWSYAVLGQTYRPFFSSAWSLLKTQLVGERALDQFREDVLFASQVYLTNQCLKVENPNSGLALKGDLEEKIYHVGQTKRFNIKVSSLFQKEVARLLVATGLNWVKEYPVDGYTVDAALVDEKVAFEIDGPSHFSRNLGMCTSVLYRKTLFTILVADIPIYLAKEQCSKQ